MPTDIDACGRAEARFGEERSGDTIRLFREKDSVTAVLAGGSGNTVRASVLSGMVVSMFSSALSQPGSAETAVETVADMLPLTGGGTFALARVKENGAAYLAWSSAPQAVFMRRGHALPLPFESRRVSGRFLQEAHLTLKLRDTLVCFGAGVARAGEGTPYAAGFADRLLPAYLEAAYHPSIPAEKVLDLVLSVSRSLYENKPPYDLAAAVFRYRDRREADHGVL